MPAPYKGKNRVQFPTFPLCEYGGIGRRTRLKIC